MRILDLDCLLGEDVNRFPGRVCVEIVDGKLIDAQSGEEFFITGSSCLAGWGDLDCPDAVDICIDGRRASIAVPRREFSRIGFDPSSLPTQD